MRNTWILAVLALAILSGCAKKRDPMKEHLNDLWLEGYGFNNPNLDRIKRGEPPLNFDGTEHKKKSFLGWLTD
jgi:hypothetical protein